MANSDRKTQTNWPKIPRRRRQRGLEPGIAARRRQALALRSQGLTYKAIATELGVNTRTAWDHVQRGLRDSITEVADELLALELMRLDVLFAPQFAKATETGDVQACGVCLKIMERRARLLGLDRPPDNPALTASASTPEEALAIAKAFLASLQRDGVALEEEVAVQ